MKLLAHLKPGGPVEPWPDPRRALDDPEGLVAAGGDLRPERLVSAYRHGLFPWFGQDQPILWWSPDPRMVFPGCRMRISRSLRRVLRGDRFRYTLDGDFDSVIAACAVPRADRSGTWITDSMMTAYRELHRLGYAHSVEAWNDGELAGGLYGVALGRVFFGESMFSRASDASKACLAVLCAQLRARGFALIDGQLPNAHLERLGGVRLARDSFLELLDEHARPPDDAGKWTLRPE